MAGLGDVLQSRQPRPMTPAQARGPPSAARPRFQPVDREKTCPLLLRVFTKIGDHHLKEDFAVRGKEPKDEVQIYTWKDATLRELTDLVKEVAPAARKRDAKLSFAFVYPDKNGRFVVRPDNVAQLMRLRQVIHQKKFCLVNVHLAVDSHTEAKLFQILYLLDAIRNFLSGDDIPIVLCGDFNMIPSSYFYNFMVNQVAPLPKFLKPSVQVAFEAKMNCFKEMVSEKNLKHCLSSLGSAYDSYKKLAADWKHLSKFMDSSLKEPVFTQLKHKFHKSGNITLHELGPKFLITLNYIFFSEEKLTCSGLLELMEKTEVHKNCGIPNYSHPSDHVLLLALFSFL